MASNPRAPLEFPSKKPSNEANSGDFLFVMVPTVMPDVYEDLFRGL